MTYAAILEAYGYERFVTDARAAGATSAIVVDLPVEEHHDVPRIQLVAPTSTDERIALCAANTDGWLYLVTVTGTTGARDEVSPALAGLVERARAPTDVPLYAGFGISTPAHAAAVAGLADGVVVGSRAVQVAEEGPAALRDYVRSLRDAIDASGPDILTLKIARPFDDLDQLVAARGEGVQLALPVVGVALQLHHAEPVRGRLEPRNGVAARPARFRMLSPSSRSA